MEATIAGLKNIFDSVETNLLIIFKGQLRKNLYSNFAQKPLNIDQSLPT